MISLLRYGWTFFTPVAGKINFSFAVLRLLGLNYSSCSIREREEDAWIRSDLLLGFASNTRGLAQFILVCEKVRPSSAPSSEIITWNEPWPYKTSPRFYLLAFFPILGTHLELFMVTFWWEGEDGEVSNTHLVMSVTCRSVAHLSNVRSPPRQVPLSSAYLFCVSNLFNGCRTIIISS